MAQNDGDLIGGYRAASDKNPNSGSQGSVRHAVCEIPLYPFSKPGMEVALKIMPISGNVEKQWIKLKKRTAELVRLNHPNIVKYYGCFEERDFSTLHVVVQEFLHGETLKERLQKTGGFIDVDEALRIFKAALDALIYTSSCGIVHRDLKPGNIFLCNDGSIKLIDFEIARQIDSSQTASASTTNIQGTFDYMAPDFTDAGFHGDAKSDIFSMGVVLHEMLTGSLPYPKTKNEAGLPIFVFFERWRAWRSGGSNPIKLRNRIGSDEILSGVANVILTALSPDRSERYESFVEMRRAVDRIGLKSILNPKGEPYTILQKIGAGGFGVVYKARHEPTKTIVAIKSLINEANNDRFIKEAKIMSGIDDPCIVRFKEFFFLQVKGGLEKPYLVMQYLEGMPGNSLRDAIRAYSSGRKLDHLEVMRAFTRYAYALSFLHSKDIIHRDIKPSNLYFPKRHPENAAIMDLGIARDLHGSITTGRLPGTPDYMPYEVVEDVTNRGSARMDIYALGLCLYEALTGKTAFERLPKQWVEEFLKRAEKKLPPKFDDEALSSDKEMIALLKRMTDPVYSKRLDDAQWLCQKLREMVIERWGVDPLPMTLVDDEATKVTNTGTKELGSTPIVAVRRHSFKPVIWTCAASLFASLVVWGGWKIWQYIPQRLAAKQIDDILEKYRTRSIVDGDGAILEEAEWMAQWNPDSSGMMRIKPQVFIDLTNRLDIGKIEIAKMRQSERSRLEREKEFNSWRERISACILHDGCLDEAMYDELYDIDPPQWLLEQGERQMDAQLASLGRAIKKTVMNKLAQRPFDTRDSRLQQAKRIMDSGWTSIALGENQYKALCISYQESLNHVELEFRNECDDAVFIVWMDGESPKRLRIDSGKRESQLFIAGIPKGTVIERAGYEDAAVPAGIVSGIFEISQDTFSPNPVVVGFPAFGDGVRCTFGGSLVPSGLVTNLLPNVYSCTYSKVGEFEGVNMYEVQHKDFHVYVGQPAKVPPPDNFEETEAFRRKKPVKVSFPTFSDDIRCVFEGESVPSAFVAQLVPRSYSCRYSKTGEYKGIKIYEDQEKEFHVYPGEETGVPPPDDFVETAEYRRIKPAKVIFPVMIGGQHCMFEGRVMAPGEEVMLDPGRYKVTFWNAEMYKNVRKYKGIEKSFVVRPGIEISLSAPDKYDETDGYKSMIARENYDRKRAEDEREAKLAAEAKARAEAEAAAKAAEEHRKQALSNRNILLGKLKELLVEEPISSRKTRLAEARKRVTDASDEILSASDKKAWLDRIGEQEKRIIGEIKNVGRQSIAVDGRIIAPGRTERFDYKTNLPRDWTATLPGYQPFSLNRNFNGASLEIDPETFIPCPVQVKIPGLDNGVVCKIDGKIADSRTAVEPGRHNVVYSKNGYGDKTFEVVAEIGKELTLPVPGQMDVLPVPVSVPSFGDHVKCKVSGRYVQSGTTLQLKPGPEPYRLEYERHGYKKQSGVFHVDVATPFTLAGPQPWEVEKVDVSVGALDYGVKCTVDENLQLGGFGSVSLTPGGHLYSYEKDGFRRQTGTFNVPVGTPTMVPPPGAWQPLPVVVSVPVFPDGVKSKLVSSGDELISGGKVSLIPQEAEYVCEYSRLDHKPQQVSFKVIAGVNNIVIPLPDPARWVPSESLKKLATAEEWANSGEWDKVGELLAGIDLESSKNLSRKQVLEDQWKSRGKLLRTVNEAKFLYDDWKGDKQGGADVLSKYHEAFLLGYRLTMEDKRKLKAVYRNAKERVNTLLKRAYSDPDPVRRTRDVDSLERDLKNINLWWFDMTGGK